MKTLLTIAQQNEFLANNWQFETLTHAWSTAGYGNSKILDQHDNVIAKRTGCGYDRFGATLGDVIETLFAEEIYKLADKTRNKKAQKNRQPSKEYYGLFFNFNEKRAYLDGACGDSCMRKILEKIGFRLVFIKDIDQGRKGYTIYQLQPLKGCK